MKFDYYIYEFNEKFNKYGLSCFYESPIYFPAISFIYVDRDKHNCRKISISETEFGRISYVERYNKLIVLLAEERLFKIVCKLNRK